MIGAAAPYLAEQIHKLAPDEASRAMAQAVVDAVTAYASGNNALAGAQAGQNAVENNYLSANDFGKGLVDMGMSQTSLGAHMIQDGASPDEIAAALVMNSEGQIPDGQNAVRGL